MTTTESELRDTDNEVQQRSLIVTAFPCCIAVVSTARENAFQLTRRRRCRGVLSACFG